MASPLGSNRLLPSATVSYQPPTFKTASSPYLLQSPPERDPRDRFNSSTTAFNSDAHKKDGLQIGRSPPYCIPTAPLARCRSHRHGVFDVEGAPLKAVDCGEEFEWQEVRKPYWWCWEGRRANRQRLHSPRHRHAPGNTSNTARIRFLNKTRGKCFNCLAPDHIALACRDPIRCLLCSRSGHGASFCPQRQRSPPSPLTPPQPDRHPRPTYRRPGPAQKQVEPMAFLGAPDTRPTEDHCIINNSSQIDRDRAEWEGTALVA